MPNAEVRSLVLGSQLFVQQDTNHIQTESIETSYPLFVIHTNHVTTLPNETLFSLCQQIFDTAITTFAIHDAEHVLSHSNNGLRRILCAIFDAEHRAFVLEDSDRILAVLDDDAKSIILAQATAGMVFILRRLADYSTELTPAVFERILRTFTTCEKRTVMLQQIEKAPLWSDCFAKAQIGDMIMNAVHGRAQVDEKSSALVSDVEVEDVDEIATSAMWNDGPHPQRTFGVPDAFTIQVLN